MKVFVLLVALLYATFAAARTPNEIEDPRALLLGSIDAMITPEALARAGLDEAYAVAALNDGEATPYVRARAVSALAVIGTKTARQRLESVAGAANVHVGVRVQAVISLSKVWGARDRDGVTRTLRGIQAGAPKALSAAIISELHSLAAGR